MGGLRGAARTTGPAVRRWRVVHPGLDPSASEIRLADDEAHHVARVLRLKPGDRIGVFDGVGNEWHAVLVEVGPGGVVARVGDPCIDPVEPDLEVTLFQSLCRPDRFEWILQKGTEIGVRTFRPVIAGGSDRARMTDNRAARWRRIVVEACKQSGRRRVPAIEPPMPILEARPSGVGWVLDRADASPLADALAERPRSVSLLVGPESGLSGDELGALERAGWVRVSLGPRVLRTETAGAIATALVLHAWSDLGR